MLQLLIIYVIINSISWSQAINTDDLERVKSQYAEQCYKIHEEGRYISGPPEIALANLDAFDDIEQYTILNRVKAFDKYEYEIGSFISDETLYKYILVLRAETGQRELELIAEATTYQLDKGVDQRRNKWMELCNAHKVDELVNDLYMSQPLYYNHKPMVNDAATLIQTYSYMNRPQYNLKLTPIIVEPVNENLVFEIGQCSGSYPGKYMLVWKRDEKGVWKILLDSNI